MGVFSEKPSLSDRRPTLSEINLFYLIIVTRACHNIAWSLLLPMNPKLRQQHFDIHTGSTNPNNQVE